MTEHNEFRVFGPPGTGKTTFLREQVVKWAREYGADALAVCSFTRTAAAEIASRVNADTTRLKRGQIGTLHSLALHSLDGPDLVADRLPEWNEAHPGYAVTVSGKSFLDEAPSERYDVEQGDGYLRVYEQLRARCTPRELWPVGVMPFVKAYENWKHEEVLLDFTDLIETALTETRGPNGNRSILIVDEAQDLSALELALVRHWGASMDTLMMAGDDDQAIYGFRGATPDAFLTPPVPAEFKRVLQQSYRVPAAVHRVATRWVEQLSTREPKEYLPREDAEGVVAGLPISSNDGYMLAERAVLHAERGQTVMILATCGYLLNPIVRALRDEGVPFHNPYRPARGDWNPLGTSTSKSTRAADRVLAYLRRDEATYGDDVAESWTGAEFKRWVEVVKATSLFERGHQDKVLAVLEPLVPVDLEWLLTGPWAHLDEPTIDRISEGDLSWLQANLLAGRRKGFEYPLEVARKRGAVALRGVPPITVGTIHSVKGGQADVVLLLPNLSRQGYAEWEDRKHGGRDATIRQFYVGMTRARDELYVPELRGTSGLEPHQLIGVQ